MKGFNAKKDRRHDRRTLPLAELRRLIDAAERGPKVAEMTGQSRAPLFAEMIETCCRRFVVHDHGKASSPAPGESV